MGTSTRGAPCGIILFEIVGVGLLAPHALVVFLSCTWMAYPSPLIGVSSLAKYLLKLLEAHE